MTTRPAVYVAAGPDGTSVLMCSHIDCTDPGDPCAARVVSVLTGHDRRSALEAHAAIHFADSSTHHWHYPHSGTRARGTD